MPFDSDAGAFLVPGPSGASAYEAWRGLGNTGTVADFLATLTGAPGPRTRVLGDRGAYLVTSFEGEASPVSTLDDAAPEGSGQQARPRR